MKKIIFLFILFTILFSFVNYAQTSFLYDIPQIKKNTLWHFEDGENIYIFNSNKDIGHYNVEYGVFETWETAYKFSLTGLPSGKPIKSVTLKAEITEKEYENPNWKAQIVLLENSLNLNNAQTIYWAISSATLRYEFKYDDSPFTTDITGLITSQHLQDSYFILGARANYSDYNSMAKLKLTVDIEYYTSYSLWAQNNFINGTIKAGLNSAPTQKTSPYNFSPSPLISDVANLEAQNQPYGGYERIWNSNGVPTSISKWTKRDNLGNEIELPNGQNVNYSFSFTVGDINSYYIANLMKNYRIDQTHRTEFDGDITQQNTTYIVEQNSDQISAPATKPINGRTYNFAGWTDGNDANPRTIQPTDNTTYTALYKYINHSNSTTAYSNNSQKKLVRTTDGYLHKVYESMGYVWYEKSTDNGITWTVENNGKPLSSNESKLPAIDINSGSEIIIVWQEKYNYYGDEIFKIRLAHYQRPGTQLIFYDVFDAAVYYPPTPYSYDVMPVIAWANNKILVSWKDGALGYRYGYADCYGPTSWYTPEYGTWVTGTDANSTNPTIAVRKDGGTTVFHLAWQQSTSAIKYCSLTPDAQNNISISSIETASTGDGINYKKNPSISIISTSPTIVWVRSIYEGATTQVSRRTRSSGVWGSFTIYGSNVESPTEYNSRVVWSENNVNKLYHPWKGIKTLSTIGKSVQLSTGNSMYAVAYRQFSPFDFQTSQDVETLPKINSLVNQCGRKAIIANGDAEFYFILADVIVDNEVIKFEEVKETTVPKNINELNSYLATNSFSLSEASSFSFSLACGAADTLKAANKLKGSLLVQFKVELVDANTNTILGELDNIIFNSSNIHSYRDKSYKVNTQGIGNRTVKLRVTEKTNFNGAYYLADIFNDDAILGKRNSEELSFTGKEVVASYDLFQNYPNPFNPTTIISYQIPKEGFVTLKVYDLLGNEIKTLVNEYKNTGRYEMNFFASDLASVVYIYKIRVNDFVASKKLVLLK